MVHRAVRSCCDWSEYVIALVLVFRHSFENGSNWLCIPLFLDDVCDSDGGSVCFEGPIGEGDSSLLDTQTSPTIFQQEKCNWEYMLFKIEHIFECDLYLHHFTHCVCTILNQRKRS